nr:type IIL restriction-modification enzyme MmeI [Streptococcus infantis]
MDIKQQKKNAQAFIKRWENRGNERQDSQSFWLDLLQSVYGIEKPTEYIRFENTVKIDKTSFIDGFIDATKVLIEQKGSHKDLNKAIKQSDGTYLTPFQQAKRYATDLPYSQRPRWIVTCNFKEFYVYDMEQPNGEPKVIKLADLDKEAYRLEFLIDKTNEHLEREMKVSIEAGEIVGEIYEGLLKQYINPDSPDSLHAINQLVVRLVFCLYAEDAGIFGHHMMFHDYLARFSSRDFRRGLIDLFSILDTPIEERDPYLDEELLAFPYVNGGMFAENRLEIPNFTDELRELILEHASSSFDWSEISPTIFGAVFESTLNPETRRSGGMHYTSIENIHKVIDPLFLDELRDELNEIRQFKQFKTVEQRAKQFQSKLSSLTFFDPACGSGNFLTETYISLRRLEYVTCWFKKAAEFIFETGIQVALVSTNSIVQGAQVPILWKLLFEEYQIQINFAYQTFKWTSDSLQQAAVHCVIIGFSQVNNPEKKLFTNSGFIKVKNISPYLTETSNVLIESRNKPISNVPQMKFGNQPRDGGNFIFSDDEYQELIKNNPQLSKWFRPYIGANEFINNINRWCIWLKHASPVEIRNNKFIYDRVNAVREFRESSNAKTTQGYAKVPHLFAQLTQPDGAPYIIIPRVTSERRRYIPIGFMSPNEVSSDAVQIIPNASLYDFGILTSNVHMAWMRTVAGRLKSDYRYSAKIVYNNFPWPEVTEVQKDKISKTAQAILDARALYPDSSLADLYDELTMPVELRRAHQANDKAVMEAYDMTKIVDGKRTWLTESETVARLFEMYEEIIQKTN